MMGRAACRDRGNGPDALYGICCKGEGDWTIGQEKCSFCGKDIGQVEKLVKSPNSDVYICETCAKIVFSLSDDSINQKVPRRGEKSWRRPLSAHGR